MSVTVLDLLSLPSLLEAKVVAGAKGLRSVVSSVSVLEYAKPGVLLDNFFSNKDFFGSEIIITAFANVPNDIDVQCANIKRLSDVGEVGIILYYVGIFMPRVDKRLIDLANELDFTIIVMPENRIDLRYSEVICEVMEAIYKDKIDNTSLVTEVLERASRLPIHQRTIDSVLRMICDRTHISLFLTDSAGRMLNAVAWPKASSDMFCKALSKISLPANGEQLYCDINWGCYASRWDISMDYSNPVFLTCIKEKSPAEISVLKQIPEVVRLAMNIWSQKHSQVAIGELLNAILQDEPVKMRRLAEIFHMDVTSINNIWIFHCEDEEDKGKLSAAVEIVQECAKKFVFTSVSGIFQGDMVLLTESIGCLQDNDDMLDMIKLELLERGLSPIVTRCPAQYTTDMVSAAFMANKQYVMAMCDIFPNKDSYSISELYFARSCQNVVDKGQASVENALRAIHILDGQKDSSELIETLAHYLLDCNCNIAKTAESLFLHKNTIKYRMKKISDLLNCKLDVYSEAIYVYRAVGIKRLLDSVG